ncbi:MAG: 2-desacetyl-2-hydroxyethyl bacteriochlorophyllide A dehydrogenase [Candidatus Azotimanducaceae bacterium]|jgi:2-desacetyl-2-hydroxyethyl bacteriochlorophyllide A dehydrogenase
MQALWIENQTLSLTQVDEPGFIENGIEVAIRLAGICGTDLELLRGYYDFVGVPGHEFVGTVVSGPDAGQRVVADINFSCGQCWQCQQGSSHHCTNRSVLGIKQASGAFAESVVIPKDNLIRVPDGVEDWQAAQAEPLAAALQILEQIQVQGSVLLVGAGRLGRMVARVIVALAPDADLTVCVRDVTQSTERGLNYVEPSQIQTATFDIAIDCTGHPEGFALAMRGVKAKGRLVVKSTYPGNLTLDMSRVVVDEIQILGSRCGPMEKAIQCLSQGTITLQADRLAYFSLEQFSEAFEQASIRTVEKVFFQF